MFIRLILAGVLLLFVYGIRRAVANSKKFKEFPPTMQYILAITYLLNKGCGYDYYAFGGGKVYQKKIIEGLNEAWNIHNEEELLNQVDLLVEHGHRSEFDAYLEDEIVFKGKPTEEMKNKVLEVQARLINKETGTLAWDLCRATQLLGWGYRAGYMEYEKAYLLSVALCKIIQENFESWEHMIDSYIMGLFYWSEHARYTNKVFSRFDRGVSGSFFNIDWHIPLSEEIIYYE